MLPAAVRVHPGFGIPVAVEQDARGGRTHVRRLDQDLLHARIRCEGQLTLPLEADFVKQLHVFRSQAVGKFGDANFQPLLHGGIGDQASFETWVQRLELDDPDRFLPRLRNVVDVLVQDHWWFDRDALRRAVSDE